tara:strand:+ start:1080 stop:2597 length:1518 start_codon:yes stop_codon:yes gene_type:complete
MNPTYNKNSIVDTLKNQGMASDFASRAKLAAEKGIQGYTGTADQNMKLIGLVSAPKQPTITPSVQTSDMANKAVSSATDKLNNIATANAGKKVASTVTNADGSVITTYADGTSSTTGPTQTTGITKTTNSAIGDLVGGATQKAPNPIQSKIDELNSGLDATKNSIDSMLASMTADIDTETQGIVDQLKTTYASRIEDQKKSNAAMIGSTNVSGMVSGRTRYASTIQDSILSAEETAGLKRINDLNNELTSLVSQAKNAAATKKGELTFKLMDKYDKAKETRDKAVQDQLKYAMDLEKLALDKSAEQRQLIKDDISNMASTAKNIASGIAEMDEKDQMKAIEEQAASYGIDANFLMTAVNDYKQQKLNDLPSTIGEYEYAKTNYNFRGSLFDYQRQKAQAGRIASTGGATLSFDEARRYQLPEELIGKSELEIIQDISVGRVPDWFKKSQVNSGNIPKDAPADEMQRQWDSFRGTEDMKVLKNMIDINKVQSGGSVTNDGGSDDGI